MALYGHFREGNILNEDTKVRARNVIAHLLQKNNHYFSLIRIDIPEYLPIQ